MRRAQSRSRNLTFLGLAMAVLAACSSATGVSAPESEPVRTGLSSAAGAKTPVAGSAITPAPVPTPLTDSTIVPALPMPASGHDGQAIPSNPEPTPTYFPPSTGEEESGDPQSAGGPPAQQGAINPWSFISDRTCGDGPLFNAFPMDLENVTNINPLGNLGPPGHTFPTSHMYFGVEAVWGEVGEGPFGDGQTFPPNPVYSVADGQLVSISVSNVTTSLSGQAVSYDEYGFDIAVCEGLRVRYGHVGPVSGRILAAIADQPGFNCNAYSTGAFAVDSCTYAPGLELQAGEQIGFNSGRAAALDIGAFDITTRSIDFLHPELYGEEASGVVCVLDLYPEDQRSAMLQMLGDNNGLRTADPTCGVLYYTVQGTLQGNWFNEIGNFTQEDLNIAFVYDEVLPEVPVISIGFVPGIQSFAYRFGPRDQGRVNPPFVEVEAGGGVFCYQDLKDDFGRPGPATHLLVEVPEPGRLLVRAVDGEDCGSGPWQIGADATEFVR